MNISVFIWDTSHDQANETMTHIFANDVNCVVSWQNRTLTLEYQNKVIDVFPFDKTSYTIKNHETVLIRIAAIAQTKYLFGKYIRKRKLKGIRHELFGL